MCCTIENNYDNFKFVSNARSCQVRSVEFFLIIY